jgi:Spy/CpxP family protein refolding chaperone
MSDEIMQGLIEAFADQDDAPPGDDAGAMEAADDVVEDDAGLDAADGADADTGDDEAQDAEGDAEADGADEPEGRKYLKVVGADGKARRVHIDELLAETAHDITVDGKTQWVSYEELRNGYQRQADYTRKTMEVAKERGELAPFAAMVAHAKTDPDFVRHVQAYFQQGPHPQLQMAARMDLADEQIAQLLDSEKPEQVKAAKEILGARAQFRRVMAERQQVEARAAQEQRALLENYLAVEREKVSAAIPEYSKQAPLIAKALQEVYGFNEAELSSVYDSRLVRLAHDAMQYRKSLADGSKLGLEGKRTPPPPPRAARPGAGKAATAKEVRRSKDVTARAMRSGRTEDWAAVIANRLGLS